MAIVRIYTNGFENGRTDTPITNWTGPDAGSPPDIITTAFGGTYGADATSNESAYWEFPETTQVRVGYWEQQYSIGLGDEPTVGGFVGVTAPLCSVTIDDYGVARLYKGRLLTPPPAGTVVGSATHAALISEGTWRHIGWDIKVGTAGWINFYCNGEQVFAYSGDTTYAGTSVHRFVNSHYWTSSLNTRGWIMDDLYIDDATGQSSGSALATLRFDPIFGTATYLSDFVGSDGDQTDNWTLVDDVPFSTATYVQSGTIGDREIYEMEGYTIPADYQVNAIVIQMTGFNLDASGTARLTGVVVTSGGTVENAAAPSMGPASAIRTVRYTTKPGGGAWDQTAIDELKAGFKVVTS